MEQNKPSDDVIRNLCVEVVGRVCLDKRVAGGEDTEKLCWDEALVGGYMLVG